MTDTIKAFREDVNDCIKLLAPLFGGLLQPSIIREEVLAIRQEITRLYNRKKHTAIALVNGEPPKDPSLSSNDPPFAYRSVLDKIIQKKSDVTQHACEHHHPDSTKLIQLENFSALAEALKQHELSGTDALRVLADLHLRWLFELGQFDTYYEKLDDVPEYKLAMKFPVTYAYRAILAWYGQSFKQDEIALMGLCARQQEIIDQRIGKLWQELIEIDDKLTHDYLDKHALNENKWFQPAYLFPDFDFIDDAETYKIEHRREYMISRLRWSFVSIVLGKYVSAIDYSIEAKNHGIIRYNTLKSHLSKEIELLFGV